MATATTPPNTSAAPGYDQFVDSRIAKTRTAVKSADVATGVVALIAWALVVLLVAAVADHWIVAGGLDRWERYALWGIGLAGAGLYVATRLGPNLWRSVNPLYAARELERETPELKNSLLNLLQLRGATDSPAIKQALERQAAERLARAGDAPIDHTPLVRAAKLLLALVALVGVYVVASPKDFFASAGRVLAPWSQIAAPSRVRITAVEPGAVTLAQGARLNLTAMVSGLKADELVELVYTSDDRQAVGRRVPMTASRGGVQFSGSLPAGSGAASALGLQGSLTYRIEAGDAHTPYYQVEVLTAPTIAPVTVRYEYPPYTGYKTREVEGVGDLRAIEGTRVSLSVEANLPIESAQIDIGADGRPDVHMTAEGSKATGAFVLRHDGDGATSTSNYVLRFTSTDGQANNDPPQYQIEVLRDLPPEAAIREPEAESIDVALNQRVRVAIEARDPDYALKRVRLIGEAAGKRVLEQDLLRGDGKGGFKAETEIVPQAIGLRPGDVLDYWVEATDNRMPQPNVSQSQRHQLQVQAPGNGQQGDRRDGEQQNGEGSDPQEDQQQGDPNPKGENGEQQPDGGAGQSKQGQPNQDEPNQDQPGEPQQPGETGENGQQGGQAKSQANEEENGQGENGQPPPGGMTGPGNKGGANSENESGEGNEGSSTSKPNDGENSPAGGSQAGETNQGQQSDQQQQPGDNQNNQNGGDQSAAGKPSPGEQPQGGEPQGGEQSNSEGAGENPVARDGSDDGSAFDKMLDWMKKQQGDKPSGKPSPSNQKNQEGGEKGDAGQDGEPGQDAQQKGDEKSQDDGQSQYGQGRGAESQKGQSSDQQGQSSDEQSQSSDESDASASEDDGGEQSAGEADEKQDVAGESNGRQGERGKEGQGGADGKQQPRNQQGGKQPDRNEQGPGAGEQDRSGQQSQSKSSESGGDTPPGESSKRDAGPREGADGAGQSQAADRGAGQSADKGAGDTSGREGGEQASDTPTGGESGDERGAGSQSRESESGEGNKSGKGDKGDAGDKQPGEQQSGGKQPGGKQPGGQQPGEQSGQSPEGREGKSGQQPGDDSQQSGDAQQNPDQQNSLDDKRGEGARDSRSPVGDGGGPMELADRGATSDAAGEGAESGGDAANLDYAREQTELVLQRLDDQLRKKEVDRKLLDKLGWTEEDLQDFVNRWKSRQQKATEHGAKGKAELDRALKSLGLNPTGPTAKSTVTEDSFRDLRENARAKTPPRMREQVESYLRSINAAADAPARDE